ncbi:MAG TPA: ABC transporter permease [Candidatus Stackebrandtia excrementipullorum]|nr:ABC transporter permease [Candidatus Stackebrandtia excrementipullorum]
MTATVAPTRHRPGPRSWSLLVVSELKMVIRDTSGLVIPIALPVLIMVMNGIGTGSEVLPNGLTVFDVYLMPLVLTMIVATIGVINMPSFLSYYRKAGILKRLSVTPANPLMILVAQVITSVIQTLVGLTLAMAIALTVFDANLPTSLWTAVGVFALSAVAMYAVGMLIAALSPTPNATIAIGLIAFFVMGAAGGMFGTIDGFPEPVRAVGEALPFGASVQAMSTAWAGETPELKHVIALLVAIVVSAVVAGRYFRWQ